MISSKNIMKQVDTFFFEADTSENLSLFRIVWGLVLAIYLLISLSGVNDFYGPHAILSMSTVKTQMNYPHLNVLNFFSSSYDTIYFLLAVLGISVVGIICGLYTRTSFLVAFVCLTSLFHRNIWVTNEMDGLIAMITFLMIFSSSGKSYSIDSLVHRSSSKNEDEKLASRWVIRLIQVQVSLFYLISFYNKLKGEEWLDGSALYYATRLDNLKNFSIPLLLDNIFALKLLTWGVLIIELSLGVFIWSKKYRNLVVLIGIHFHLFTEIILRLPFQGLVLIPLFIVFYSPKEIRVFVKRILRKISKDLESTQIYPSIKSKIIWAMRGEYAKN